MYNPQIIREVSQYVEYGTLLCIVIRKSHHFKGVRYETMRCYSMICPDNGKCDDGTALLLLALNGLMYVPRLGPANQ